MLKKEKFIMCKQELYYSEKKIQDLVEIFFFLVENRD